jgi:hypothetical protein
MAQVKWRNKPEPRDYPAAGDYLALLVADPALRAALVEQLRSAPLVRFKATDLLRAAQLPLLTSADAHVAADLKKIRKRVPLSPVLLVRGDLVRGFPLQVADGYHRVCASHLVDEDTDIPCRLIDLPAPAARRPTTRVAVPQQQPAPAVETVAPAKPAPVRKTVPAVSRAAVTTAAPVKRTVVRRTPVKAAPAAE